MLQRHCPAGRAPCAGGGHFVTCVPVLIGWMPWSSRWSAEGAAPAGESNFEADEAHELDAVAFGDDTFLQLEIEFHLAVFDLVLEMDVVEAGIALLAYVGQGEVVSADEADGSAVE